MYINKLYLEILETPELDHLKKYGLKKMSKAKLKKLFKK
jgi:hypothetical protein